MANSVKRGNMRNVLDFELSIRMLHVGPGTTKEDMEKFTEKEIVSIPEHNPRGLKPGDRVVVDPYLYCGHCYPCTIGRTNCCTDLQVLGVHVDGGMAEYFCHPADMLIPVPDDMTDIQAAWRSISVTRRTCWSRCRTT